MPQNHQKSSAEDELFSDIQGCVSYPRLAAYLDKQGNKPDALALYLWNIALCEALYPSLHGFEILLRNRLHNALHKQMGTQTWFDDPQLLWPTQCKHVAEAKSKLTEKGKPHDVDRIVAEFTFGFWASLYSRPYISTIVVPTKDRVFPYASKRERTPRFLAARLQLIRDLRNRVFHHEAIWHWQNLDLYHENILQATYWISPPKRDFIALIDRFDVVYKKGWVYYQDHIGSIILDRANKHNP